jgi:hypothetical protein
MMDQGMTLKGRIIKIKPEEHPYRRVKTDVFYEEILVNDKNRIE